MKKNYLKTVRCCLTLFLALAVCLGMQMPAFAAETDDTLYLLYIGDAALISPHYAEVMNAGQTHETTAYFFGLFPDKNHDGRYDYGYDVFFLAYCCDLATGQGWEWESYYQILNLEDADYYTEEQAKMLRTVVENGFWDDWDDENVEKLGEAAGIVYREDEQGNVIDNGILLPGEAMTATQLAIWLYANSDKENVSISKIYKDTHVPGPYENDPYYDYYPMPFEEEIDPELNQYTEAHMRAVIEYLKRLAEASPTAAEPSQIIFSDKYTTEWTYLSCQEVGAKFEITLRFALLGDPDNYGGVNLSATYGEETLLDEVMLCDPSESLSYDSDKNEFTLTFQTDTLEEDINMELAGEQIISPGFYLFQSEGNGETSQNFIGKVEESMAVPVNACFTISLDDLEPGSLNVKKEVEGVATDQAFSFTIQLDLADCRQDAADDWTKNFLPDEKVTSWRAEDGVVTIDIMLKDGETYTVTNIPAGASYTVTEADGENLVYAGDAAYAEGMSYTPDKNEMAGAVEGDVSITFVNTLYAEETPPGDDPDDVPPTGDRFPMFGIAAVSALSLGLLALTLKRRKIR